MRILLGLALALTLIIFTNAGDIPEAGSHPEEPEPELPNPPPGGPPPLQVPISRQQKTNQSATLPKTSLKSSIKSPRLLHSSSRVLPQPALHHPLSQPPHIPVYVPVISSIRVHKRPVALTPQPRVHATSPKPRNVKKEIRPLPHQSRSTSPAVFVPKVKLRRYSKATSVAATAMSKPRRS